MRWVYWMIDQKIAEMGGQRCACPSGEWRARHGRCYVCGLPLIGFPKAHTEAAEKMLEKQLPEKE